PHGGAPTKPVGAVAADAPATGAATTHGFGLTMTLASRTVTQTEVVQARVEADHACWAARGATISSVGVSPSGDIVVITVVTKDLAVIMQQMGVRDGGGIRVSPADSLPEPVSRQSDFSPWVAGDRYVSS
ncbi:MAG: hypothetical protein ACYCYA_13935, partial [Actinomycetes bacterium]